MTDWQERITRGTEPAIRAEHDLRYRLAAPLIASSKAWADLGCGTGLAAAAALGNDFSGTALLVDIDHDVVVGAAQEVSAAATRAEAADLSEASDVERIAAAIREGEGPTTVTCFETVEHLADFVPLIRALAALAQEGIATVVLSVPNDAFWTISNPHHQTMWGEGAFDELRSLLGEDCVAIRQVALAGSATVREGAELLETSAGVTVRGEDAVPTHMLLAFGPRASQLEPAALVSQVDMTEERRWVRQRESDNAFLDAVIAERDELREIVRTQFDEWRAYIHELEAKLGLPPSGSAERAAFDAGTASPALPPASE